MDTQQPTNQPTIVDQFVVKVKLLSNEVYEFVIDPQTTKVSDLKRMILEKISIPLDKQRIIFGAKQLLDDNKVTQYVKESGLTVHLIARMGAQENTNQTSNTTSTTQQSSTQQTNNNTTQNNQSSQPTNQQPNMNNNPFGNLLMGMGLGGPLGGPLGAPLGGPIGGNLPQATTMTFTNMGDLSSSLGGILGSLGIRLPQQGPVQQTQPRPTTTQNPNNNPFQTPPTNSQRQTQQARQPTSSFNANLPQQVPPNQPQSSQNAQFHVSNEPILRLNQTISTLDLPSEPVMDNRHLSLREQTAQYLRRLQHQYMRMIPQLNRSVQLLNEGRVTHLNEVLRLFEAIDGANQHAEQAIRRLINLPVNQTQNQQNSNQPSTLINQQSQSLNFPNNTMSLQGVQIQIEDDGNQQVNFSDGTNNVQATIIIQENQIDDSIDGEPTVLPNLSAGNQPQQNQNNRATQQPTVSSDINLNGMGGLSSLLQGLTGQQIRQGTQPTNQQQSNTMGGLNLGGIMSMLGGMGMNMPPQPNNNRPPQQQSTSQSNQQPPTQPQQQPTQQMPHVHGPGCNHQHAPQPSQQPPQQFPQIDLSNLASMANMFLNPQQQQQSSNQQSPSQQPSTQAQQPQNPMGSLMGMFSSLQQSGGMGQLLNTSLGQTLQEGLSEPTIYSTILKSFTGSDILTCFTSKNFDFLDRKYENVRENFLNAISIAGSQQELTETISSDIADLLVPKSNVNDYEECLGQVTSIVRQHVSEIVGVTLNRGDVRYSQKLTVSLKHAFCQALQKVIASVNLQTLANGQSATRTFIFIESDLVFQNLKVNVIQLMDEFIQGLSGMFYGFIERDLIRIYNEYRQEQKRKQQRSMQQVASQEELLKQIETESKKDIEYLKNFRHSQYYHPKAE